MSPQKGFMDEKVSPETVLSNRKLVNARLQVPLWVWGVISRWWGRPDERFQDHKSILGNLRFNIWPTGTERTRVLFCLEQTTTVPGEGILMALQWFTREISGIMGKQLLDKPARRHESVYCCTDSSRGVNAHAFAYFFSSFCFTAVRLALGDFSLRLNAAGETSRQST